jgi:hypothetical protein
MSYGAEIFNSNGETVFNTEDPTYEVVSKGTASLGYALSQFESTFIWSDPNYSSSYTQTGYKGYRNTSALGNYNDDSLIFYEILPGQAVYKLTVVTSGSSVRRDEILAWHPSGHTSIRYVVVRPTSSIASSGGYGAEFYNAAGQVTWTSTKPVLSNVLPLSQTSTTNRWFCWTGDKVYSQGSSCGVPSAKGIRASSSSFIKQSTGFGQLITGTSPAFCGLPTGSQAMRGLTADVNWGLI